MLGAAWGCGATLAFMLLAWFIHFLMQPEVEPETYPPTLVAEIQALRQDYDKLLQSHAALSGQLKGSTDFLSDSNTSLAVGVGKLLEQLRCNDADINAVHGVVRGIESFLISSIREKRMFCIEDESDVGAGFVVCLARNEEEARELYRAKHESCGCSISKIEEIEWTEFNEFDGPNGTGYKNRKPHKKGKHGKTKK